jgi:outer membrane murein-binding lipoprotein Lpp
MKLFTVGAVLLLAGCAGGTGGSNSKNDIAASACETYAKTQLGDKTYKLDLKALAGSMKAEGDMQGLSAPIVVEPGTNAEAKETLDCKVRFSPDGKSADVINLNFIF